MSRYSEMNADERTADIDERTQDTHDTEAARADERREEFRDLMIAICRPSCTLIGHQRYETKPYCRFCGAQI
jgi:hypothetical protein